MSGSSRSRSYSSFSGGGGSSGGGAAGAGPKTSQAKGDSASSPCAALVVDTILNSPVPKVVNTLKKGDRLGVKTQKAGAVVRLVAVDSQGQVAGSLTPPELLTIIACISEGFVYVAVVRSDPKSGSLNVRIQAAGS